MEFIIIILPQVLAMTVLAEKALVALSAIVAAIFILHGSAVFFHGRQLLSMSVNPDHAVWHLLSEHKMTFINNFRAAMMAAT